MVFRQPELLPGEAFFKVGLDNHMLFVLIYFIDSLRTSAKTLALFLTGSKAAGAAEGR